MSNFNLSLPTQIPWRRLATSRDMMDTTSDRIFPPKWKSSMSIFYYHPEVDEELYPGRTITYLKVVCSVTGFQVDGAELGLYVGPFSEWRSGGMREAFNELEETYYPCYGAMLHVAVFPGNGDDDLANYPYIVDFEPKKREMFELVTQTGEAMSGSASTIRVGKNSSTLEDMETIDVYGGYSFETHGEGKVGGIGGGGGGKLSENFERGFRSTANAENVNIRTIDDSREKRESLSHTTQLTQMYHLLDSYHLGTNRALFVVFPRPHIVDVERSVTNGLRRLEGIQEFFLVVEHPSSLEKLCIEAQLETSHLHKDTSTVPVEESPPRTGAQTQTFVDVQHIRTRRVYQIRVPSGTRVDRSRGSGGWDVVYRSGNHPGNGTPWNHPRNTVNVRVLESGIDVEVIYDPGPDADGLSHANFAAAFTVYWIAEDSIEEPQEETVETVDLWMTGRHLGGCLERDAAGETWRAIPPGPSEPRPWSPPLEVDFVTFEENVPTRFHNVVHIAGRQPTEPTTSQVNELGAYLKERIAASVHNPRRYAAGTHSYLDTDFVTRSLVSTTDLPPELLNNKVEVTDELRDLLDDDALETLSRRSVAVLLATSTSQYARNLGVSTRLIADLKLANLGIPRRSTGSEPNEMIEVPSLEGMPVREAREKLRHARLTTGDVIYHDSPEPPGVVLNQYPHAGATVRIGAEVDLILATGESVEIPDDIIGKPLIEARQMLRNAGLKSEPQIVDAPSEQYEQEMVLDVTPAAGEKVTPNAQVTLHVSSGTRQH